MREDFVEKLLKLNGDQLLLLRKVVDMLQAGYDFDSIMENL